MKPTATFLALIREISRHLDDSRPQHTQPPARTARMYRSSERTIQIIR